MTPLAFPHSPTPESAPADGSLSRFRNPSARLGSQQGMSLIELLVVAAIISMMAGLLALGLKGMKAPAIQGAASQVTSGLSLARQLAISKNTKAALIVETLWTDSSGALGSSANRNGRVPFSHWAVVYSNKSAGDWTVAKKWEQLPDGAVFLQMLVNDKYDAINTNSFPSFAIGQSNAPSLTSFNGRNLKIAPSTSSSNYPCIMFSSDGAAITGNSTALTNAAIHIASGLADTNGQVTLTSQNQYYFVETDGIVGRIRMRAPESYK